MFIRIVLLLEVKLNSKCSPALLNVINLCFTNFRYFVAEIVLLFYPNESKFSFKAYFPLEYERNIN